MLANADLMFLLHAIAHSSTLLYREPKTFHTTPIFIHHALTVLLRIIAIGEQHALVAGGFLILANTAGLFQCVSLIAAWLLNGVGASGADGVKVP